jgi:hypothetical protein
VRRDGDAPRESIVIPRPSWLTLVEGSFRDSNSRCIHFFRIFGGMRSSASSTITSPLVPPSGGSGGRGSVGGVLASDRGDGDDTIRPSMEMLGCLPADMDLVEGERG